MKTTTHRDMFGKFMILALAGAGLGLAACGGTTGEDNNGSSNNAATNNGSTDDNTAFIEAVPTAEMVGIDEVGAEGLRQLALESEEEDGPSASLRDHIATVRGDVQDLLETTHDHIDKVIAEGTVIAEQVSGEDCRAFTYDGVQISWRLLVCRKQGAVNGLSGQAYGWVLGGRALDAAEDAEFSPIAAGVGARLQREDGKRGGAGRVGYDFDNLAALNGETYGGKLGIGYRAAGRARQSLLGLKGFKPRMGEPRDALYTHDHLIGRGGRLRLLSYHDFLMPGMDGMGLELGQDATKELGRAVVAWNTQGKARVTMAACGGTVGEGTCAFIRQCFDAGGPVTFSQIAAEESELMWEPTSCGRPPLSAATPPSEADVSFDGDPENMGIPSEDDAPVEEVSEDAM